jgi:hypothetical protein
VRQHAVLALALLVAACGSTTPTPASSAGATPAPPTAAPEVTIAPTPVSSVAPSTAPTSGPVDGAFIDPEGLYLMRVDPGWTYQAGGFAEGIEFWFLGPPERGLQPNLNVLTQVTGGLSLTQYIKLSIRGAPAFMADFELVERGKVAGEFTELGVMRYTGSTAGTTRKLAFLAIFAVSGDRAIVATLTTPLKSFDDWRAEVEPYMLSLRPT